MKASLKKSLFKPIEPIYTSVFNSLKKIKHIKMRNDGILYVVGVDYSGLINWSNSGSVYFIDITEENAKSKYGL